MSIEDARGTRVEDERILDVNLAWEEAEKIEAGYIEAQELGIGDRASEVIMAHGHRYMVAEALTACSEFGKSIRDAVENMEEMGLPEETRRDFINRTIDKKVAEAAEAPVPDEIVEREAATKAANEAVKKN